MKLTPLKRKKRMARHRAEKTPSKRPVEYIDEAYLEWLRTQRGVFPGGTTPAPSVPHHARHDANGASLGRNVKDDTRAIPMSTLNHDYLHSLSGPFKGWTRQRLHDWLDDEIAVHRQRYFSVYPERAQ